MAKILFLNIPAFGHVNPTLAVVSELVRRGAKVRYALPEPWRETIESAGGQFTALTEPLRPAGSSRAQNLSHEARIALMPYAMAREAFRLAPELERLIQTDPPDCVVFNELDLIAKLAVRLTGVPAVAFRPFHGRAKRRGEPPPEPFSHYVATAEQTFAAFLNARRLPPRTVAQFRSEAQDPTIVFVAEAFQVDRESFDDRFVFVGPSLAPSPSLPKDIPVQPNARRVLVSLGTLRNDEPQFYRLCFDAFGGADWQAFMSIGRTVDPAALGAPPDNFIVRPHLPQTALLQVVDLFVTHAGLNSVMESLFYGVPMILLPVTREQRLTAQRCERLGLGVSANLRNLIASDLRALAARTLDDASISRAVAGMQTLLRSKVGYDLAADVIDRVVASGCPGA